MIIVAFFASFFGERATRDECFGLFLDTSFFAPGSRRPFISFLCILAGPHVFFPCSSFMGWTTTNGRLESLLGEEIRYNRKISFVCTSSCYFVQFRVECYRHFFHDAVSCLFLSCLFGLSPFNEPSAERTSVACPFFHFCPLFFSGSFLSRVSSLAPLPILFFFFSVIIITLLFRFPAARLLPFVFCFLVI